jgi:hypothetical protein
MRRHKSHPSLVQTLTRSPCAAYFSVISNVLSVDPSLTTISSKSCHVWASALSITCERNVPALQTGGTTEIRIRGPTAIQVKAA